jgi:hypothetical protein
MTDKVYENNPNGLGNGNSETFEHEILKEVSKSIHIDEVSMSPAPEPVAESIETTNSDKESIKFIEVPNTKVTSKTKNRGHIAYKIPTDMTVRSTYQVTVRISKSKLHIFENINGEVHTSTVPITETMEVKVIDPSPSDNKMFEIIPDNQPVQLVENNEHVTQWTFNVTPLRSGTSKLKIVISIIRDIVKKEVVYEDDVTVKSDITKSIPFFIATHWQWLLSTLVIPIII